jgi:hypothetical protein
MSGALLKTTLVLIILDPHEIGVGGDLPPLI